MPVSLIFYLSMAVALMGAGATGMRVWDNNTIKDLQLTAANTKADQAAEALNRFVTASKVITDAANGFGATEVSLNSRVVALLKGLKNAQTAHPLAADCRPDAGRVQSLADSIAATNTVVGQPTGK